MDLAMPGMDGWETIRRIREEGLGGASICILSANAFEKNVDDLFGISGADFIVKPFRVSDLLDWIGTQLALEWIHSAIPAVVAAEPLPPAIVPPGPDHLATLREMIDLGYMRGIREKIDAIERLDPVHEEFVRVMRALAGRFQFEPMKEILRKHDHGTH
jgi:CheY-like chemotaxis protein